MTSTSFNVGLTASKSSSRVLKPPGGGHSDIFGINEGNEIVTPKQRQHVHQSTINSCFFQEDIPKPKENIVTSDNTDSLIETNGKSTENGENGHSTTPDENTEPISEVKEEKKILTPEPPKRVRVPPGGFSSGLW